MKIEVSSAKNLVLDTGEQMSGIYPVHSKTTADGYADADHNAIEIESAIKKDMLPVLFLDYNGIIVVCNLYSVIVYENLYAYEFRGFISSDGYVQVQVDINGKVFLPR